MKILVVTPTFLPIVGGAEVGIYEIFQRLGQRHEVRVITPRQPDRVLTQQAAPDEYFSDRSFETCYFADRLNPSQLPLPGRIRNLLSPFSPSLLAATVRELRRFRPDVVNHHYALVCGLSLFVSQRLFRVPSVLSLVGRSDVLGPDASALRQRFLWWVVRTAALVVPNSGYYLKWRSPPDRVRIIPYGVDTERFRADRTGASVRDRLAIPADVPVLFALQRLATVKRTDVLIRAMPAILRRHPRTVLVIGGKGPERAALRTLADELDLAEHVMITDYIPEGELADFFAMADVFTFHSTSETFGIVLAQAMATGTPIVSVASTSIPEVVDDGVTGTLVDPLDPEALAGAVSDLLSDGDRRRAYGRAAREKAVRYYSWDSVARQYEDAFESLLQTSRRSSSS